MVAKIDGSGLQTTGLINSLTAQNTTSGTSFTFSNIPSTAKRVTMSLYQIGLVGSDFLTIKLGTSGGTVTTGYTGAGISTTAGQGVSGYQYNQYSSGFALQGGWISSSYKWSGNIILMNITSNIWTLSGVIGADSTTATAESGGGVTLSSALTTLILGTNGGTTFNNGSVNVFYE